MIIGLAGPIGVGKTHVARALSQHDDLIGHSVILSFATPLKAMLESLVEFVQPGNPIPPHEYTKGSRKDDPLDWADGHTMRHLMQTLGTEWGRDLIAPSFWADLLIHRAVHIADPNVHAIIFDDCRFETERASIEGAGGKVFELVRYGATYPEGHRSEGELSGKVELIDNNGTANKTADRIIGKMTR